MTTDTTTPTPRTDAIREPVLRLLNRNCPHCDGSGQMDDGDNYVDQGCPTHKEVWVAMETVAVLELELAEAQREERIRTVERNHERAESDKHRQWWKEEYDKAKTLEEKLKDAESARCKARDEASALIQKSSSYYGGQILLLQAKIQTLEAAADLAKDAEYAQECKDGIVEELRSQLTAAQQRAEKWEKVADLFHAYFTKYAPASRPTCDCEPCRDSRITLAAYDEAKNGT